MIHRRYNRGQKLDVAGLNEIAVLIDRSRTARTEVALNTWRAGLVGPPHRHAEKEQTFFVTSGAGWVVVAGKRRKVRRGDVVFVPAGVEHQTIAGAGRPLEYLLFNAFLTRRREGHKTFAEHIRKVKALRRRQAEQAARKARRQAPPSSPSPARARTVRP
jgi:quercetin dioxygenase-like cupin family protein